MFGLEESGMTTDSDPIVGDDHGYRTKLDLHDRSCLRCQVTATLRPNIEDS
jgi:hypothetical protein